jgi:predicted transcriptional regulator
MTVAHTLPSHARETVHGGKLDAETLLSVLPTAETPGFDLLSPRSAHVLLALFDHLRRFGYVAERAHRDFTVSEPWATWTVQGVASAIGIHRNQAGKALAELMDFGYLTREDLRRRIGQFGGFAYALRLPTDLSPQAKRKLKELLKEKHQDLSELRQRALRYLSETELNGLLMEEKPERNNGDSKTRNRLDSDRATTTSEPLGHMIVPATKEEQS